MKKITSIIAIVIFLINPIAIANFYNADVEELGGYESVCYGFIVTYSSGEDYCSIEQINSRIWHMINDLLREQIPVFWTAENKILSINEINPLVLKENLLFEQGSFLIPFIGNLTIDKKIIAIMYDYNQSSEIENEISIPIYLIIEPISLHVFPLNNVKIALFKNPATCGESLFLMLLSKIGFLDYEIIWNSQINSRLNNDDFNVLFHAGGIFEFDVGLYHMIQEDIVYKEANGVRSFVNNGGGYIGVCGGLIKASAGGMLGVIPFYLKRRVNNPNLRSIGVYSIVDILTKMSFKAVLMGPVQVKITSSSSPIIYGLDEVVWDVHFGGPQIQYVGDNVEVVANFYNTGNSFDGTPSWLSSTFGNGRIAVFVSHPEIAGIKTNTADESMTNVGRTTISNSLFYTTAEDKIEYQTVYAQDITFLEEVWDATKDLTNDFNVKPELVFSSIKNRINENIEFIAYLSNNVSRAISIIEDIADKNNLDLTDFSNKYYLGLDYAKDTFFYYNLFTQFLKNTTDVLEKIENVYCLLKQGSDFEQQLEDFTNDLSSRINEIQDILQESQKNIDNYEQSLLKYKESSIRRIFKERQIKKEINKNYLHVFLGFSHEPAMYFNSLKFLRHHWYDYESNVLI